MSSDALWTPLLIAAALAWISAFLGFFLYQYGEAAIERQRTRLTGAVAIAAVAFIGMTKFYIELNKDINDTSVARLQTTLQDVRQHIRAYETCADHEKLFACIIPANDLQLSCAKFTDQVSKTSTP
ncbi:MAG: hypothetical protein H0X47_10070 [Nitrospirales bacterium]|nr:hypothetical protein [Nitrospirales bacterium]